MVILLDVGFEELLPSLFAMAPLLTKVNVFNEEYCETVATNTYTEIVSLTSRKVEQCE